MKEPLVQPPAPEREFGSRKTVLHSAHGVPRHALVVWASMMALPALLVVCYLVLMLHDMLAPREMLHCWHTDQGGLGIPGPPWIGVILHWLCKDWRGQEYNCEFVLQPRAVYVQVQLLLLTWAVVIWSSWQTRRLRRTGVVCDLVKQVFEGRGDHSRREESINYKDSINADNPQVKALLKHLATWGRKATWRHLGYTCAFQLTMFTFDWFVKGYSLRFILYYQVIWFSFSEPAILQVGLLVMYCVQLSLTLVDVFIEGMLSSTEKNYLMFAQFHKQLEMDLTRLWGAVNVHTVMPAFPYLTMSFSHLLCDPESETGLVVATFLLSMFGVVFYMMLRPIASIASCFNSSLVLKGESSQKIRRTGSLAIVAAVRRMAYTDMSRSALEEQRYATFLHYVQGCNFYVALGIPGIFLLPVSSDTSSRILSALVLKFPAFISIYLGIQKHIDVRKGFVS